MSQLKCPHCGKQIEVQIKTKKIKEEEPIDMPNFDIGIIEISDETKVKHEKMRIVANIINENSPIAKERILLKAKDAGVDEQLTEETIERLERNGMIYSDKYLYHWVKD